jgi:hypothetical protein
MLSHLRRMLSPSKASNIHVPINCSSIFTHVQFPRVQHAWLLRHPSTCLYQYADRRPCNRNQAYDNAKFERAPSVQRRRRVSSANNFVRSLVDNYSRNGVVVHVGLDSQVGFDHARGQYNPRAWEAHIRWILPRAFLLKGNRHVLIYSETMQLHM